MSPNLGVLGPVVIGREKIRVRLLRGFTHFPQISPYILISLKSRLLRGLSQPQNPQWYPPAQPQKQGLSAGAIIAIVVSVVVVVIVVGVIVVASILPGIQQSANLSRPNVAVTNEHATYYDCSLSYPTTSRWYFDATLVNTGGAAYVDIGYDVNGQQVTGNTYFISSDSQLPVSESVTVSACYGSATPQYSIVLLSERLA